MTCRPPGKKGAQGPRQRYRAHGEAARPRRPPARFGRGPVARQQHGSGAASPEVDSQSLTARTGVRVESLSSW